MRHSGRMRALTHGEARECFRETRLLFTVTTGRSGTEFLTRALALYRGVCARHEPKPTFSSALRSILAFPGTAKEFWLAHKLPAILRHSARTYVETSHLACKGFLESLVELGAVPELIVLRRDPRAVAQSLCNLQTIPGRTFAGIKYYLAPSDPVLLPLPERTWLRFSDYQLAYWYCLEIDARARAYQARWMPLGLRFHRIDFEHLTSAQGIESLAATLSLPPLGWLARRRAERLALRPVNQRQDKKRGRTPLVLDWAAAEADVLESLRVHGLLENVSGPTPLATQAPREGASS